MASPSRSRSTWAQISFSFTEDCGGTRRVSTGPGVGRGTGRGAARALNDFGQGADLGQDPVGTVQVPAEAEPLRGKAQSEPAADPPASTPTRRRPPPHHVAAGPRCRRRPRLRDPEPLPGGRCCGRSARPRPGGGARPREAGGFPRGSTGGQGPWGRDPRTSAPAAPGALRGRGPGQGPGVPGAGVGGGRCPVGGAASLRPAPPV